MIELTSARCARKNIYTICELTSAQCLCKNVCAINTWLQDCAKRHAAHAQERVHHDRCAWRRVLLVGGAGGEDRADQRAARGGRRHLCRYPAVAREGAHPVMQFLSHDICPQSTVPAVLARVLKPGVKRFK